MRHRSPYLGVRASWGIVDQLISSGSNFAVVALVAATSSVDEFGAFAVAYTVYALALGVQRAVGGEILLLRVEQESDRLALDGARLVGLATLLGIASGALLAFASLAVEPEVAGNLRALGAVLPFLLAQDALRYYFFASRRPTEAVLNDAVWAALALVPFATIAFLAVDTSPNLLILIWGAGAAVSAILGLTRARTAPRLEGFHLWFSEDRRRVSSFLADFVLTAGAFLLALQMISIIAGIGAIAAMHGAQLLFTPFAAVVSGARIIILPALANVSHRPNTELRRRVRIAAQILYGFAIGWAALVLVVPDPIGRVILGDTWSAAKPLLPWVAVYWVARTGALPALDGLRALGGGRRLVALGAITGSLIMIAAVAGSWLDGALGATIGLTGALLVSVVLWWDGFLRATHGPPYLSDPPAHAPDQTTVTARPTVPRP